MFSTLQKAFKRQVQFQNTAWNKRTQIINKWLYFPIQIFKNLILMSDRKVTYGAFLRGGIKNLYVVAVFYISSLGYTL